MKRLLLGLLITLAFTPFQVVLAQNENTTDTKLNDEKIRVFIDCRRCNDSYIRTEVSFVNFVRDKEDADVHLLITRQGTGSGTEFSLQFIGRKTLSGQDNLLRFFSPNTDTDDDERRGLLRNVKLGLFPYASQTNVINNLNIVYASEAESSTELEKDPWNNWIFELGGRMSFNGEESSDNLYLSGNVQAERITEEWKIFLDYYQDYNRRRETFSDTDSLGNKQNVTKTFISKGQRFYGQAVKSIGEHWALGLFSELYTSTRNNYDLRINGSPGVEYNIFPYSEYTEREFTFSYRISPSYRNYADTTIFNKTEEFLIKHQLQARAQFTQPWGEIEGRTNFSAFSRDLSKNRLDMNLEIDFRIFRGLSLNASGRYSLINDQLSVPKGDISDAEQLLNLRQRLTGYSYRLSFGLEYTFGSIYNSVVNPRF